MRYDAIAELLGVETATVKVRIHRALKELREIALNLSGDQSWNASKPQRTLRSI
jgi:DNA-directed RNA polymerase specialized sigma24 family protein